MERFCVYIHKQMMKANFLTTVYNFYRDGFRSMTVGKTLWIIILIKLFIIFVILRLIFFPDLLKSKFHSDKERSEYVTDQLINTN